MTGSRRQDGPCEVREDGVATGGVSWTPQRSPGLPTTALPTGAKTGRGNHGDDVAINE